MEYATQYCIGLHSKAKKAKAAKAVRSVGGFYHNDATSKRRAGNQQGQVQVCPHNNAADGFLKTRFLPKLEGTAKRPPAATVRSIETDFYRSLNAVATHYTDYQPMNTGRFGYPYNIALSVWELECHLKRHVSNWHDLALVRDDGGKTFLISEERYCTGTDLYYIPVIPLYRLLHDKSKRNAALLLLSVCAYLYHIADVPYYRQENAYIYWEYEMIGEWIEQDDDAMDSRKDELEIAQWYGDKMEQKIFNRKNLTFFSERVKLFNPVNEFEQECLKAAKAALALYSEFPETTIFQHAGCTPDDESEDEGIITMRKYISFVAHTEGWLYESLAECINNEFNECGLTEEPIIVRRFDGDTVTSDSFDFEERVFQLIDDLCYLLNHY